MKRSLAALVILLAYLNTSVGASTDTAGASTDAAGAASSAATIEALFLEGTDAYNKDRDHDRALRLMNAVLEADPNHGGALYYRAMISIAGREWEEATADIDRALAIDPNEERFLYTKGRIFETQGDTATALEWYSKALEQGFHSESLRARIALRLDAGEYQKALDDCAWLMKHQPDTKAIMLRARAYLGLGDYEKALEDCNTVIDPPAAVGRSERTTANFLVRAEVLLKLNMLDGAYYDLVSASYLEQSMREPILALGDYFLFARPDMRQAIAYYTAAIEVEAYKVWSANGVYRRHEPPIARLRRGQAYVKLDPKLFGKMALEDFARYIELEPGKPDGYVERAKLYIARGETDKARADLEKALELDPANEQCKDLLKQIAASEPASGDTTAHDDPEPHDSEEEVQ